MMNENLCVGVCPQLAGTAQAPASPDQTYCCCSRCMFASRFHYLASLSAGPDDSEQFFPPRLHITLPFGVCWMV